jgi:thioredoxin-like negative regulator of GroEL
MDGENLKKRIAQISSIALFVGIMLLIAYLMHPSEKVMGILQMDSYKYEESEKRLLDAHQKNPRDLVTIKSLIQLYYRWGKRDAQYEIGYYKKYIAISPKDTEMRKELARTYSWEKIPDKAVTQYEAILEYDPGNIEILRKLAGTFAWDQQHQKAIKCMLAIHVQDKFEEEDYRNLVKYYISSDMGRDGLEQAIKFNEIHRKEYRDKFTSSDYINLANLNLWLGKRDKALKVMESMLRHYPRDVDVKMVCIYWLLQSEEEVIATEKLKEWLTLTPDNLALMENYVDIYLKMPNQEDKAIAILERITRHPEVKDSHQLQYYWMLVEKKLYAKAYHKSKGFDEKFKENHDLWGSIANLCFELKLYEEALVIWNKQIALDSENVEARENAFNISLKLKREKESKEHLFWLLKRFPNNEDYIKYALEYFNKQKDYDSIALYAKKGMSLNKSDPYYSELLVNASLQKGDKKGALTILNKLIKDNPENFDYAQSLLDIYIQNKDKENAIKIINSMWDRFASKKENAEKIALMYSWVSAYPQQLASYINLEKRDSGYQYWDLIFKVSQNAKDIAFARGVLEDKIYSKKTYQLKDVEELLVLFQVKELMKEQLVLLNKQEIEKLFDPKDLLELKSKLYEALGDTKNQILTKMELYENHKNNDAALKKDILLRLTWLKDNEFKKKIYKKLAPSSLEYANILLADKKYKEALAVLKKISGNEEEMYKAHELILSCEYEMKNQEGVIRELTHLINSGQETKKASSYLSQRASLNHELGKVKVALNDAENALKSNPDNAQAHVIKGYALYDLKKYPEAAASLKRSGSKETYPRFLRGAALYRFTSGNREGVRVFRELLREYHEENSFYKWDLVLNIGYEMNSPYLKERAFHYLITDFCKDEKSYEQIMPRYTLHLLYTGRRIKAEKMYKTLKVTDKPNYIACKRIFEPQKFKGNLSVNEKLALADYSDRSGDWFQATLWLP